MRPDLFKIIAILLFAFAIVPASALAEESPGVSSFSISPVPGEDLSTTEKGYFVYELNGGTGTGGSVLLKNLGNDKITVELAPVYGKTAQTGGSVFSPVTTSPERVATWVSISQSSVTLEPGTQRPVSFSVSVPQSVRPGQYLAGIAAYIPASPASTPTAQSKTGVGATITVQTRYVIGVQVNVPGNWSESLEVTSVKLEGQASNPYIGVRISNNGDTFLKPSGSITLTGPDGKQVLEKQVKMGTFVPRTDVTYPLRWSGELKEGLYKASVKLDYGAGKHASYDSVLEISSQAIAAKQAQSGTIGNGDASKGTIGEQSPQSAQAVQQTTSAGTTDMWPWSAYAATILVLAAALSLVAALLWRAARRRARQAS